MPEKLRVSKKLAAFLVYGRPPLVFAGLLCAIAVMWTRNPLIYTFGVGFLFISMSFDLVDGWFAARFSLHSTLTHLTDRIMDKVVYSIIFPLAAVGMMWRLEFVDPNPTRAELLHAIFVLLLCVTVLIRDSFAHFIRGYADGGDIESETSEFTRLRTVVAAPVGALLYARAFYIPEGPASPFYQWLSAFSTMPLRGLFIIEIIFLIINFGSLAGYCRKYGRAFLDDLCVGDERLRRRILSFFPNALTVMNAMMGLLAVFFAYQGRVREAYLLLIGAAIFDKLDGAVARRLGLTEPISPDEPPKRVTLGGIMDDISDAVSFCIVPAWIFLIVLSDYQDPVMQQLPLRLAALIYAFCGISRLIYFTFDPKPIPGFFKGLPSPAAALFVAAPFMLFSQAVEGAPQWARFWGIFCFIQMIFTAVLMNIYPIRYIHMGRFMDRHPWFARINLLLLITFVFTPYFGLYVLICLLLYLLSPLVTGRIDPSVAAREKTTA